MRGEMIGGTGGGSCGMHLHFCSLVRTDSPPLSAFLLPFRPLCLVNKLPSLGYPWFLSASLLSMYHASSDSLLWSFSRV